MMKTKNRRAREEAKEISSWIVMATMTVASARLISVGKVVSEQTWGIF